jgi:hypothetical protein
MPGTELVIRPGGAVEALYSPAAERVLARVPGLLTVARASRVEPEGPGRWTADLSPVGGPVLGPFPDRDAALAAEVAWLRVYHYQTAPAPAGGPPEEPA